MLMEESQGLDTRKSLMKAKYESTGGEDKSQSQGAWSSRLEREGKAEGGGEGIAGLSWEPA